MIARNPSRPVKAVLGTLVLAAALAGCSSGKWGFPYRADMQQGNWITREQVALLQPGMSREQVRFALGSPTLTSVLHADRWDYPYYFKPGYGKAQERHFTVFFENDRLVRWDGDQQPELQPFQINLPNAAALEKADNAEIAAEKRAEQAEKTEPVHSNIQINTATQPATSTPGMPGSSPEPLK
ncbi:outer membrane protein assembly factor BamE [Bordetella holmesii]|uniref:outer membrane protein assembly factor BamE n=1 Tax=Bordetella holmesii TaxID=35814 RepID=UPI00046D7310|nr:outer membrane protein assembly factor BamE [Bordetella holmesii]AMD50270.1 membrane protein [Bordetella holmesii F627]MBO1241875.1 outer membrane protein assembly factor BamE [Bordetella holmesii]MBO1242105.1 outer membrane protein assembly factor BamE [Bordetella holmesii]MBO1245244.1 outer membrane protein assembly factor BamE [Bordetella holmesii]MBO1254011.1 outer membrane protein assembly factor BamE [Bordetella holmesii]